MLNKSQDVIHIYTVQPTFIIDARLEVGVTLSAAVELLTLLLSGPWLGSQSIGVDVNDRWLLLLLLSDEYPSFVLGSWNFS